MKRLTLFLFGCASCVILYFVAKELIDSRAVPPLGEFMANNIISTASSSARVQFPTDHISTLRAGKSEIQVALADTDMLRIRGLSNVDVLPEKYGMLFVFPRADMYGFWMKDMHFPLDIVWIDEAKKVVGISENISPDTFPKSLYPKSRVMYVLEINGRSAKKFDIATGTQLMF